jgi:membrane-associated phospholipid phosphatase
MYAHEAHTVWKTYGIWAFWVGVAFFGVYPACNWITARRSTTISLYLDAELGIPFVPESIWVYLSMYALFLAPPLVLGVPELRALGKRLVAATLACGVAFLLIPAKLGFERVTPDDPFYGALYTNMFAIDLPHNMAPSLHVVFSALIVFAVVAASTRRAARVLLLAWLALLAASTLLTHQHHLVDVATGLAVAAFFHFTIRTGGSHAQVDTADRARTDRPGTAPGAGAGSRHP